MQNTNVEVRNKQTSSQSKVKSEVEMEKVPGGKYSTTQNSEHKDSVEMENRRSGHSKLKSGGPTLRRAERKET